MSRFFYAKLALSNLNKNKGLYLPYIVTAVGMAAMFYIMLAISFDKGIREMPGADLLGTIMAFGSIVIGIFSIIFLFYTNSFLMKRRKKEFGLFHILGMEKRHIGKMMFWETITIAAICILGGLAAGVILNKLIVLLLLRITRLEVPFGFSVSFGALQIAALLFISIFAGTLLFNLCQVQRAKPIELLKSTNQGEAEPKTRWLLTAIGIAALGAGYYIAITTKNPMEAIPLFFVAVILVMIGTYCLFTAGSIAVLKLLRRNKRYYYQISHFTSVSGMIYRMKQNAVGLANICILSTAVLVMISGTVSMYAGMGDIMDTRYPMDVMITGNQLSRETEQELQTAATESAQESGLEIKTLETARILPVAAVKNGEAFSFEPQMAAGEQLAQLIFMTLAEYEKISGEAPALKQGEILTYVQRGESGDSAFSIHGEKWEIKEYLKEFPKGVTNNSATAFDSYCIVVKDDAELEKIDNMQQKINQTGDSRMEYSIGMNVSGSKSEKLAYEKIMNSRIEQISLKMPADSGVWIRDVELKDANYAQFYVLYGGFLFLGIFLGSVFLMATVLIIYYKQISEGYEDKERFEIMQKVGMSKGEVRASIRSQILNVFFLPLVTACIHLIVAFPLVSRLLLMLNLDNTKLFALCTLLTAAVFAAIYGIVYSITAKSYYKIVG